MNNPPHDWDDVAFDDFGEIVAGGTPSRAVPSFWNGDIPWVTPSEITALKNKHRMLRLFEFEMSKLSLLKSALMADLLTGRVRVPADLDLG